MGGTAYIIGGTLAAHLQPRANAPDQAPQRGSLWQRLRGMGKTPAHKKPGVIASPKCDRHFEIKADALESGLIKDFRDWVFDRVPNPSTGSKVVLHYLADIRPRAYLRGFQKAGQSEPEFFVQIVFSGCAGEAEVSAAATAHWASLWYAKEHERIATELLLPAGFTTDPVDPGKNAPTLFLSAGDFGYLEYTPPEHRRGQMTAFEMDNALSEAFEGHELLKRLDEAFAPYMEEGRCRCQLCDQETGDATPHTA